MNSTGRTDEFPRWISLVAVVVVCVCGSGCENPAADPLQPATRPPVVDSTTPIVSQSVASDIAAVWHLRAGGLRRYRVQAEHYGTGEIEERVVEETPVDGFPAFRLRALHRYDSGRTGVEELFVRREGRQMVVVARMTSSGSFGTYDPPMVAFAAPIAIGTSWQGATRLTETDKLGRTEPAVPLIWEGAVTAIEAVTVPAGRFLSCIKVRNAVGGSYETTEWFARTVGVVRREVRGLTAEGSGPVLVLQELVARE